MQSRHIYTCAKLQNSKMQLGRFFNKVMKSDQPKKNRSKKSNFISAVVDKPKFFNVKNPTKGRANRRVSILNKVFMKYITDLMSTGEVAAKLVGKGIEITHVKVTSDFQLVNVYWCAADEKNDENESIEQILQTSAKQLQHELSQLRVIGSVPPINFVKNRQFENMKELDERLANADFGEDYDPKNWTDNKISILKTKLSSDIKAKLDELDNESNEENDIYELTIPEMRHNVMGFDHSSIMNRIKHSLKKSEISETINIPEEPIAHSQMESHKIHEFLSNKQENKIFHDFIKQRRIEEKRKLQSKPLLEIKLQEETEFNEEIEDFDSNEDCSVDDNYEDNYKDIQSQQK